jgi:hypothetical protein
MEEITLESYATDRSDKLLLALASTIILDVFSF